jgi:hypothetical protein
MDKIEGDRKFLHSHAKIRAGYSTESRTKKSQPQPLHTAKDKQKGSIFFSNQSKNEIRFLSEKNFR